MARPTATPALARHSPRLFDGGSLLDKLLVTLATQLATALSESTVPESAAALTTALPDLLSGLVSF